VLVPMSLTLNHLDREVRSRTRRERHGTKGAKR
jgi:hypothetical protein